MFIGRDIDKLTCTQKVLAEALNLSTVRIYQLIKEGIVVRDPNDKKGGVFLVESCRRYWRMKNRKNAITDDGVLIDIEKERALHEAADRKLAELKLAKLEGRVFDATTVELKQVEVLSNLRTRLLGLPAKLAPEIEMLDEAGIEKLLTREIEEALDELPEYSPELYLDEEVIPQHGDDELE